MNLAMVKTKPAVANTVAMIHLMILVSSSATAVLTSLTSAFVARWAIVARMALTSDFNSETPVSTFPNLFRMSSYSLHRFRSSHSSPNGYRDDLELQRYAFKHPVF